MTDDRDDLPALHADDADYALQQSIAHVRAWAERHPHEWVLRFSPDGYFASERLGGISGGILQATRFSSPVDAEAERREIADRRCIPALYDMGLVLATADAARDEVRRLERMRPGRK